jgi:DNA (cytosine-5)-methyltransferase 1
LAQALKAIDLFSGCGGMTLGLRRAGFEVVVAVEVDPLAVETYRRNHPRTLVIQRDIRKVDAETFAHKALGRERLDLLAACPPCQGYSAVRTLKCGSSTSDKRNKLVFDVLRFVAALKPRSILFENVPGLLGDWRFAKLRRELKRRGYLVRYSIEDAACYGVPQRRKRLLLLATQRPLILTKIPGFRQKTVRDAIWPLPPVGKSGDALHDYKEKRSKRIVNIIKRIPKNGGSRRDLARGLQLRCHKRTQGFFDVYGRMAWDDVAPTITSGCINPSKGRFLHPEQNRAITLREAALLQSFPIDYKFSLTKGRFAVAEMIGNALPPALVEVHATILRKHLETC